MAHKLPIIASDLPVIKEILNTTENHLLFNNGNVNDLSSKMKEIIQRKDFIEMGYKSKKSSEMFQINAIKKDWELLFESLFK